MLTVPVLVIGQGNDLPENSVFFIDQNQSGVSTARSIIRSDLSGQNIDTLGIAFGNTLALGYVPETNEYLIADQQRSRLLHLRSDFTSYRVVMTNRDLVYTMAYDAERNRYFYTRIGSSVVTRGLHYFDGPNGTTVQLDNRFSQHMVFHPDSNAVYYALGTIGVVKHQMDRDERSTLIAYTSTTRAMTLDQERGHLYLVYNNNLYRYDLNDPDAEPEFLFVMGFGTQVELAMSFDSEREIIYVSAKSGFSRNTLYQIPINDLDSEVEMILPFSRELNHLHYNPVRNELVFTDGGNNSPFSFIRGYNLDTEITANYGLRDVTGIAADPATQTIYGIDRFFIQSSRTILFQMDAHGTNRKMLHEFVYEQREIAYDSTANRLFILGYNDAGSHDVIWEYDLNSPTAEPEPRVQFEKNNMGVWRILSFDVDVANDIVYLSLDGEGIMGCPGDEATCTLILNQGDRIFSNSLAFNPEDSRIYFTDNDMGIASVHTDGSGFGTFIGEFNPMYGLQYNGVMGKMVWSVTPFSGQSSLRYRDPLLSDGSGSRVFFSGRDIKGMDFMIGNPTTVSVDDLLLNGDIPASIALSQNYPNPFNPTTSIRFELPQATEIRLSVYDVTGRQIRVLSEGYRTAGTHTVPFDAGTLSSGVYLYRLETPGFSQTMKMTLIK